MRLLQFQDVEVVFPGRVLFQNVTWSLFRGERTGIVGPNGAGKTTLLKLIMAIDAASSGAIQRARGLTLGYLPQQGITHKGRTLFQEAWGGLPDLPHLHEEIEHLRAQITAVPDDAELIEHLGALEHRWQDLEGYAAEAKVARVLGGLGFGTSDFERRVEEFSGGWQMRIALAKLLLYDPDLLLLDEPTNHLDLPALMWLEEFLSKFAGALVLVSHDRLFLDRVINRIAELEQGRLTLYPGNYSEYESARDERRAQAETAAERGAEERRRIETFVERFRYKASKAKQVQSRVKMLEKMETVEVRSTSKRVRFRFPPAPPSGRFTLELAQVKKKYGELQVFHDLTLVLARGEKVALVGPNGAGKSTLCRLIVGVDQPTAGHVKLGHNVSVDYFAQEADFHLREGSTVLAEMEAEGAGATQEWLRSLLGAFLFSGDDVFKPVSVLSGGEKARLALAKMLLHPSNFLILDEPTNHLDMASQNVLLEALNAYDGTLLVVSHDRFFLDKLVNRVLELAGGEFHDYPGNLSDFLRRKAASNGDPVAAGAGRIPVEARDPAAPKSRDRRRLEAEIRNRYSRQLKAHRETLERVQSEIDRHESRKADLESKLATESLMRDGDSYKKLLAEYESIRRELSELYAAWEQSAEAVDCLERERDQQVRAAILASGA
ncbi:ABC-F family ATP-binding cassette domain-containing protein [candidate division KSB1 bacterium]|nr:ABC-F family ATP-binding cassette domain-containing protein [candidate division KSB1 bacterium]